ncbi:hypothetical protein DCAR_0832371 [Daucus carota subsp. sativus]|uniref:Uncharacterized protein n=1 Tax=Daucus carota subsp. sativus TaxID=79200 RepID=A0AAF1BDD5_DAUCS|nr:PREDICTED: uncharacterized protein LOC108198792 [Daucus carota subsp. sativus]WOH12862.1 hypothetical protein DCAR_0832371 [Daucus carota subsp. sativus]
MISLETIQAASRSIEPISSPRISFSADLLDDEDFITINPNSMADKEQEKQREKARNIDFEFLSNDSQTMLSADELLFDGKLLPFWQTQQSEKLKSISLKTEQSEEVTKPEVVNNAETRVSWLPDEDPSPRPPTCTVLWKELLRLRKQRASSLSPSSSSSSSTSSSSLRSLDLPSIEEGKEGSETKDKHSKRIKKGLERTRSASIRIRPVVNVPICTQAKSNALPPRFSFRKAKSEK